MPFHLNLICCSQGVLVTHCCITNPPKIQWLETVNMHYLTVPLSQESRHTLLGASGQSSLTRCCQGFGWGSNGGGSVFKLTHTVVGREFSFLQAVRLGAWVPSWVLACGPALVLHHTGFTLRQFTTWQVTSIRVSKWGNKTGWARRKPETFCKLISQMTPYPFYSVEAIHWVQLTLKGRGLHKGMNTGRSGLIGNHFRSCPQEHG